MVGWREDYTPARSVHVCVRPTPPHLPYPDTGPAAETSDGWEGRTPASALIHFAHYFHLEFDQPLVRGRMVVTTTMVLMMAMVVIAMVVMMMMMAMVMMLMPMMLMLMTMMVVVAMIAMMVVYG